MSNGRPEDWHSGCQNDAPRNDFIIPQLVNFCQSNDFVSIGFLGCATGYIPKKVSDSISAKRFKLLDVDQERLEFAKSLDYNDVSVSFEFTPIENLSKSLDVDLMVISNTLLEFTPNDEFFKSLKRHLQSNANVIVFLPDILEDVVQEYVAGNRLALQEFIKGVRAVEKIDKFTLVKTEFFAHRLINLAKLFLDHGFYLQGVEISETKPRYFMLTFGS